MPLSPRPEIYKVEICQHGGTDHAELEALGISPDEVLDFSANLNPFGPPPGMKDCLSKIDISHYPERESTELKRFLAEKFAIKEGNLVVGNGSTELIRLVSLAYLSKGDKALIIKPTFGEYDVACRITGAQVIEQWESAENHFEREADKTIGLIQQYRPKVIFVCNPNNPTGRYLPRREVERLLEACSDSLVVMDEAHITFTPNAQSSVDLIEKGNLLVLRSMTKDYALAGLRLGYAMAEERVISYLRRICPPWNVNALAQKAGVIAFQQEKYLEECREELNKAKEYLVRELTGLSLLPLPSEANFFLVEVGEAREIRQRLLLHHRILVRDCTSFGLPGYVRIASRTLSESRRLVEAVREVVSLPSKQNIRG